MVGKSAGYTLDKAVAAAQPGDTVKLLSDVIWAKPDSGYDVLTLNGITLDLNGHTLTAPNFSLVFEGRDFTIRNGSFSANGDSYALFMVKIPPATSCGGSPDLWRHQHLQCGECVLRNADVTGTDFYAVWCDVGEARRSSKAERSPQQQRPCRAGACRKHKRR